MVKQFTVYRVISAETLADGKVITSAVLLKYSNFDEEIVARRAVDEMLHANPSNPDLEFTILPTYTLIK